VSGSPVVVADHTRLEREVHALADAHGLFADLLDRNGLPPLWRREPSFATLVRLILEQQVSLRSAAAAFGRLEARVGVVIPGSIIASTDDELRADGFSRQKTRYVRGLAGLVEDGTISIPELAADPETARSSLLAVTGIGSWTASCFQLFALGHPDVWPSGDRALYVSLGRNLGRDDVPEREEADTLADSWAPYRSSAARMLWYDYLGGRSHVDDPGAGFL
jgi:DNA-3-methyladenine glycosylase II